MNPFFAELPDSGYLLIGCVIIALIALGGLAAVLRTAQSLRSGLAEELRREIASAREPSPVAVQQPLTVKAHPEVATVADLDQVHGRIKRERMEIDRLIAELRSEDVRLREKLDADIADLHERINNVPERTISLLRETKGLIA